MIDIIKMLLEKERKLEGARMLREMVEEGYVTLKDARKYAGDNGMKI